jgi:hypothetical protein
MFASGDLNKRPLQYRLCYLSGIGFTFIIFIAFASRQNTQFIRIKVHLKFLPHPGNADRQRTVTGITDPSLVVNANQATEHVEQLRLSADRHIHWYRRTATKDSIWKQTTIPTPLCYAGTHVETPVQAYVMLP